MMYSNFSIVYFTPSKHQYFLEIKTMEKVVIYSRVSTKDQNCEKQIQLLKKIVDQNNWGLIDTYVDVGISV